MAEFLAIMAALGSAVTFDEVDHTGVPASPLYQLPIRLAAPRAPSTSTMGKATSQVNAPCKVASSARRSPAMEEVTQPPANAPQVKDNGKQAPTITIPQGQAPPTELQTYVLIKGDGKPVQAGQQLLVQYTGVLWSDGSQFDSSFSHGGAQALQVGTGSLIKGWDQGLVGQTVGSRVMLVVPPSLGYGSQSSGPVPAMSGVAAGADA